MTPCDCGNFKPSEAFLKNKCRNCDGLRPSMAVQKTRIPLRRTSIKRSKPKIRKGTIHKAINPATGRVVSVKTAKTKAWVAFARYIRNRDPQCVTCGAPTTEAGHYFHTSDKQNKQLGGNAIWWNIKNVNGQCGTCNRHKSGNLAVYTLFLEEKYGHGIIQELRALFNTPKKYTIEQILETERVYLGEENAKI